MPTTATAPQALSSKLTPLERRSSASLALIFALRMLGLFLVMPVFALEAQKYPGGDDPAWIGLAMGIYGLTQGFLQIPFGLASDRFGRKRVMVLGLFIFALGSGLAAWAPSLVWLVAGRALQGAGAISAAVTALLADQTRDVVRTKAMALVGASIGLVFALALVLSPILNAWAGLPGLFAITGMLAVAGVAVVLWWVPPEPQLHADPARIRMASSMAAALQDAGLLRLYVGVFVLHAVQIAMWVALPAMLVQAGLAKDHHWWIYLPVVLGAFLVMGASLFRLERRGYLRAVFLSAIAGVTLAQLGLLVLSGVGNSTPTVAELAALLFLFFCGFNILEASQPSLASRLAPVSARGAALGVYNTLQSLGLFTGGALGGWLLKRAGPQALFAACAVAMLLWLVVAWSMHAPKTTAATALPKAG